MSLRVLARTGVALLAVSTAFPVLAALLYPSNPARWLGVADVATATLVFVAMATLAARARNVVTDDDRIAALRIGQGVAAIVPALLAAYFIVGPR